MADVDRNPCAHEKPFKVDELAACVIALQQQIVVFQKELAVYREESAMFLADMERRARR